MFGLRCIARAFRNRAGIDCLCCGERRLEPVTLRERCGFRFQLVDRADFEQLHETSGPPQRVRRLQQPQHCVGLQGERVTDLSVMPGGEQRELTAVLRHPQPVAQRGYRRLVGAHGNQRIACGKPELACGSRVERHARVRAGGSGKLCGEFWQHCRKRSACGERAEHARRVPLHQAARELLPHPLRNQRISLAIGDHGAHQLQSFRRDCEIEASRKARDAQDAHRVFGERGPDVSQYARLEIGAAAERIDDAAPFILCNGVNGQIAPREILLERDLGRGVEFEAVIAACSLAFGACECIFLVRFGVQKHREVFADRFVAELDHLLGSRADHDIVAVLYRQAQQFIAYGTAYRVDFHRSRLGVRSRQDFTPVRCRVPFSHRRQREQPFGVAPAARTTRRHTS